MTHIDVATSAAKRAAGRRAKPANLSELLISLRKQSPKDTDAELDERFVDCVAEGNTYAEEAARFWLRLNRGRLLDPPKPLQPRSSVSTQTANDAARAKRIDQKLVLEIEISGKKIGDHTCGECLNLGGAFTALGKAGRINQKVRSVVSNAEAAKLAPALLK